MKTTTKHRNTGIKHVETIERGNGYTVTYSFHGSTLVLSKDFPTMEAAQEFARSLRTENSRA